jgi:transposase
LVREHRELPWSANTANSAREPAQPVLEPRGDTSWAAVAIEATTGWRWFARELQAHGFEVHLVDPGRASALRGRRRQPTTDRLDARWLALLLARDLLSECEARLAPSGSSSTRT